MIDLVHKINDSLQLNPSRNRVAQWHGIYEGLAGKKIIIFLELN